MASHEGPTLRYQDAQGHVFSMKAADAKNAGYTLVEGQAGADAVAQHPDAESKAMAPAENKAMDGPPNFRAMRGGGR